MRGNGPAGKVKPCVSVSSHLGSVEVLADTAGLVLVPLDVLDDLGDHDRHGL